MKHYLSTVFISITLLVALLVWAPWKADATSTAPTLET